MKCMLLALPLAMLTVVGSPTNSALAQDTKVARGTVVVVGGTSVTVKVRDEQMRFNVDSHTRINAPGAGTKTQQASTAGKSGSHLGDLLRAGQAVAVTYHDEAGTFRASTIRAIPTAGGQGGSIADVSAAMTSSGTVKAIGSGSVTIVGSSGGGAKFTQTFVVDADTTVIGKGAGTAAAAKGGKALLTDLIASGDRVTVSYHKVSNGMLHASDVRVMIKATH